MSFNFLRLFLALAFVIVSSPAHSDRNTCPEWMNPDNPILENTYRHLSVSGEPREIGGRFDSLYYYWNKGAWFQIHYGFMNPWGAGKPPSGESPSIDSYIDVLARNSSSNGYDPTTGDYNPDLVRRASNRSSVDFAFWMPSKRYVERRMKLGVGIRPCEAGRKQPTRDEYVIKFRIEWPFREGSATSEPARRFRNAEQRLVESSRTLHRYPNRPEQSLAEPVTGEKFYFIHSFSDELAVTLRCSPYRGEQKRPNPLCDGWVWDKQQDLILYLRFPAEKGQDGRLEYWREPVNATIELVESWKIADPITSEN